MVCIFWNVQEQYKRNARARRVQSVIISSCEKFGRDLQVGEALLFIQVLISFNMTPPAKWFLDREDDSVFVCTSAPGTATSPGRVDRQGIVRDTSHWAATTREWPCKSC